MDDTHTLRTTGLQMAAKEGHSQIILSLLDAKATDVEQTDGRNNTALHYAAYGNRPDIIQLLLEYGANVNACNIEGETALHIAVKYENNESAKLLIESETDMSLQDYRGDTVLHIAVRQINDKVTVVIVHQLGEKLLTLKNFNGYTVLHEAVAANNVFAVEQLLIRNPFLLDIRNNDGMTPLHLAASLGFYIIADRIVARDKKRLDSLNSKKQTALMVAAEQGHASIVECLVTAGSTISFLDVNGNSCLHLALSGANEDIRIQDAPEIVKIWFKLMQSVDHPERLSIACFLASRGADEFVKKTNNKGLTPLDMLSDKESVAGLRRYCNCEEQKVDDSSQGADDDVDDKCMICADNPATIQFSPCGHIICCQTCSKPVKKCIQCRKLVEDKVNIANAQAQRTVTEKQETQQKCNGDRSKSTEQLNITEETLAVEEKSEQDKRKTTVTQQGATIIFNDFEEEHYNMLDEPDVCSRCGKEEVSVQLNCAHKVCIFCSDDMIRCDKCHTAVTQRLNII